MNLIKRIHPILLKKSSAKILIPKKSNSTRTSINSAKGYLREFKIRIPLQTTPRFNWVKVKAKPSKQIKVLPNYKALTRKFQSIHKKFIAKDLQQRKLDWQKNSPMNLKNISKSKIRDNNWNQPKLSKKMNCCNKKNLKNKAPNKNIKKNGLWTILNLIMKLKPITELNKMRFSTKMSKE